MNIEVRLFGAFRAFDPDARVVLELPDGAIVGDVRAALRRYGETHWSGFGPGLLARSAFASETSVLHDREPVPQTGRLAVLPPVSGG